MADVHVHPNKLPCDEESSFVVVLKYPLPKQTTEFSLMFKGTQSGREILGRALKVDQKTLIGVVGAYGKAEEVEVRVVGLSTSVRVDPFRIVFCTRFQLICGLFPDDIPLQAPVAVACCLHSSAADNDRGRAGQLDPDADDDERESDVNIIDEELTYFCKRNVPTDLSFKKFFGSDMIESMGGKATMLHFAAERGYKQFAAHLLAESGGAYDAMTAQNRAGLAPAQIAERQKDDDLMQLFIDYEDVAADNAVPLSEYADFQKLMSEYNYVKIEQKDGGAGAGASEKVKKKKKSKKNLLAKVVKWKTENKDKTAAPPEQEEKKKKSIFRLDIKKIKKSIGARLETLRKHSEKQPQKNPDSKLRNSASIDNMPAIEKRRREPLPPTPAMEMSDDDLIDEGEDDDQQGLYEDVENVGRVSPPKNPKRPKSHYMKKVIAKGIVKKDYSPLPGDTQSLRLKKGQEVNVFEDTGAPWVIGECAGSEGRIMRGVIHMCDPDYEPDVGGALHNEFDSNEEESGEDFYEETMTTAGSSGRKLDRRSSVRSDTSRQSLAFVAIHDWVPERVEDLKIYEGEMLEVVERSNDGWWTAKNSAGKTGTVPSTYLKENSDSSSPRPLGSKSSGGSVDSTAEDVPAPRKFAKPMLPSSSSVPPPPLAKPLSVTASSPGVKKALAQPPLPTTKAKPAAANAPKSSQLFGGGDELSKVLNKKKKEMESSSSSSSSSTLPSTKRLVSESSENELSKMLTQRRKKEVEPGLKSSTGLPSSATCKSSPLAKKQEPFPLPLFAPKTALKPSSPPVSGEKPPAAAKKPLSKPTAGPSPRTTPGSAGLKSASKPPVAVKPKKKLNQDEYRCLWDYEPESADDLPLRQGDIVVVTERSNGDWWIGECRGDKGIFPASFVEKIT